MKISNILEQAEYILLKQSRKGFHGLILSVPYRLIPYFFVLFTYIFCWNSRKISIDIGGVQVG